MSRAPISWIVVGLSLLMFSSPVFAAGKAKYPQVRQVTGAPVLVEEAIKVEKREAMSTEKLTSLKNSQILRDKAQIRVPAKSRVQLSLNAQDSLTIFEGSELFIPTIAWEDGVFRKIVFEEGRFRYTCCAAMDAQGTAPTVWMSAGTCSW